MHIAIVVYLVGEVILVDDVLGEQFNFHSEVLVSLHWGHEVEVLDIDGHEFCIRCGDDAVEQEFDREEIGSRRAAVIWIVDEVASDGDAGAVGIFLLRSIGAYDASICDVFASFLWDHRLGHENYSLGGGD